MTCEYFGNVFITNLSRDIADNFRLKLIPIAMSICFVLGGAVLAYYMWQVLPQENSKLQWIETANGLSCPILMALHYISILVFHRTKNQNL